MNQRRVGGVAFVGVGLACFAMYFIGGRGTVWLALGVAFVLLGTARLKRTPRPYLSDVRADERCTRQRSLSCSTGGECA